MDVSFPAVGHRYLVGFQKFKVVLSFTSDKSLTYTVINPDGSAGQVETVAIRVERIVAKVYLVTWQEADKTAVVHVEDYDRNTIITNITNPDNSFDQFHGTFVQLDNPAPALRMPLQSTAAAATPASYAKDIRPLFRDGDISCMARRGVMLANFGWISVPQNAGDVYAVLSSGEMPPDGPWSTASVTLFKAWIDQGLNP